MLSKTDWLTKTDWLIEQQIARYFTILSTVICRNKICLLTRSPSVNMSEDEEANADDLASEVETDWTRQKIRRDLAKFRRWLQERVQLLLSLKKKRMTFASHFSFIFIVFAHENSWLCLGIFSSREICRKPTGQNTAGSFLINFTSHAIKRRQHSILRDADILRSKEANNYRDLQIILQLLSSRQHVQPAWMIPTESHPTEVSLAEFCMDMFDGGKWQRQLYSNFIFGIEAQF